ncbi:GrpB family protein [Arthrobacter sp. MDT1-65]
MHWQLTTAETVAQARAILEHHRRGLSRENVPGELTLTGGSSIEGLLTKGDIDLHLRVTSDDFAVAVSRLRGLYAVARKDIWTPWFAVFEQASTPPVGVAVTILDSEHDRRFVRSWERMRLDKTARQQYNMLKVQSDDVEEAKSLFFTDLAFE